MMKRRSILTICLALFASISTWCQTAVLSRGGVPMQSFFGADALRNAISVAEVSGDVIVLSSGTFNNPGQISKSVSIYGKGFEGGETRTLISGKLEFRSTGEGSLDGIHLEGLYLENHLNLLNDNARSPINGLTVVKCHVTGMFLYMESVSTLLRGCVIRGDLKSYPGTYKATGMLIENCWKDGGSFNYFTDDSDITVRNSIVNWRSLSGFDNSKAFTKASYEGCVVCGCTFAAGTTAKNCVLVGVDATAADVTLDGCTTVTDVTSVFENATTCVYSEGAVPTVKAAYGAIGITAGTYAWNPVPSMPTIDLSTTLRKDGNGYYQIGTVADWEELNRVVTRIDPTVNARMTRDIDLGSCQTMIGDAFYNVAYRQKPFCGIFDGGGHTLTMHYVTAEVVAGMYGDGPTPSPFYFGCAPFCYVYGGTIKNLNTAGEIEATHEGVAGIVGWTNGAALIENCRSSVDITYTNGARGSAGIAYDSYNNNHVLTIRDCVYDGTLTAGSTKTGSAGFVVYRGGGTVNIYNSLVAAGFENGLGSSDCATFVRNQSGTISNSYYQKALGTLQGMEATADELSGGRTAFYLQAGRADLVWGQKIGVDPLPVLTNDESKRVYRSATGYTNNPQEAVADQSLVPLNYTRDASGNLTITGFDPGFTPPTGYALVIPDEIDGSRVTAIGNSAFYQRSDFTTLHIGKYVKTIGNEAFRQAKGMKTVSFASGCAVESFGNSAFRGCDALTSFTMPNTVTSIGEMCFQANPLLATVKISNQLTVIASRAFAEDAVLNNVEIPASVTTIGANAFYQCRGLTSISFPGNVTKLGGEAFRDCSSLTYVNIPATITSMDANVFWNSGVKTADVYCSVMGQGTFYQCSQLESVTIHEGVKTLGLGAFHGCGKLPTVTIPKTVTTMLENVFQDCVSLKTVTFASGIGISAIPKNAFYNTGLTSIDIPSTVTSIGENAFRQSALPSVRIPSTVTSIGVSAFNGCASLQSVTFVGGGSIPNIPSACFYECRALESISIPLSVTSIDGEAFRRCSAMTAVDFPSGTKVTTIGNDAFRGCSALVDITLPESVTSLGERAFQASTLLEHVKLPSGLTVIKNSLFAECSHLNDVDMPSALTMIESYAFSQCTGLETITLPQGLRTIGTYAFQYCEKLNNVTLPGSLTSIQDWAFRNCTSMENLTIEEGVTSINRDVFQYSGMKKLVLPSTLEFIGVNLFHECTKLEELDLSKCVNIWELYNMTTVQRTGGSGQWNIFFGVPASTVVKMPAYAKVESATNVVVDKESFNLTQDGDGYYLIKSATDWDKFVVYSREHPTINGRLTKDLDLREHQGRLGVGRDESNYFTYQGTLDGQGHTLKIAYKTGKDVSGGLFTYVENATIKNLKVEGKITANNRLIGGFVGLVKPGGTLTMEDCESAVDITVTPTTTNMHIAGFIGQGKTGTVTLTDCLFTGSITGESSFRYAAGFMGWMESAGRIAYNYCLNNGTFSTLDTNYSYALGATQSKGQSTAVACFVNAGGNALATPENLSKAVTTEQLASGLVTFRLQGSRDDQHWGQKIGEDPAPKLTHEVSERVYRNVDGYSNTEGGGTLAQDAEGNYLIGSVNDWKLFAMYVDEGMTDMNCRMTADINLGNDQTMIGSGIVSDNNDGVGNIMYEGIFDGQGHTLTIHYNTNEIFVAPFRHIRGATIKNLRVAGTIATSSYYAGGIVSNCFGQQIHSYITNCVSSVKITSSYVNTGNSFYDASFHGGIVARLWFYGQLHITDCVFNGSISGETRGVTWGGMMGLPDGTVTITNCLQVGTFDCSGVTSGGNGSGTFSTLFGNGYASKVNISNCYYLNQLGNAQGTKVTTEQLSDGTIATSLQASRSEEIWVQDNSIQQPMLAIFSGKALPTLVPEIRSTEETSTDDVWFTLEGIKLDTKPVRSGVYIHKGKTVFVSSKN